ncbi:hypothetical protein KR059_007602 [Drosophila kikkawai]|nr:hypothetical protein KR059_007602 [Drosophila kikkawai]
MDSAPLNAEKPVDAGIEAETEAATCNDLETEKNTSAGDKVIPKILDLSKEQEDADKPLDDGIEAVATYSTDPESEKEQEPKKMKKNKRNKKKKSHHHDDDKAERKAAKKKKKQLDAGIQEDVEVTCSTLGATDPETEKEALEDDKASRKRSGTIEIEEDPKKKKIEEIKTQDEADAAPSQGEGGTSEEVKFNVPKSPLGTPKAIKGTASAKAKLSPF